MHGCLFTNMRELDGLLWRKALVPGMAAISVLVACSCDGGDVVATSGPDAASPGDVADSGGVSDSAAVDAQATEPHGLRAAYFRNYYALVSNDVDATVDFDWGANAPIASVGADQFAVRWTGVIEVPEAGTYGFQVEADDGVRLWVDGDRVLDAWKPQSATSGWIERELPAEPIAIKLTYFEQDGNARVILRWRRPGGTEEVIPTEYLRAAAPDESAISPRPPYKNPVSESPCADPGVLKVGDWYYAACTGGRFRIRRSRDLVNWRFTGSYILPEGGPPWSSGSLYHWAPELHFVNDKIVAYFTAADGDGQRAVGAAPADDILGPYEMRDAPLVTNPIGVIDPNFFQDDDGKKYLLWKVAGTWAGMPTQIYLRRLGPLGLGFAGGSHAVELIRNDPSTWEGSTTEAPWLMKHGGYYYLFYSGNATDARYRVGVARATQVTGPYTKLGSPILRNSGTWVGPGHQAIAQVDGLDYLVYHAWGTKPNGDRDVDRGRLLMVDRIRWVDGWPKIADDGKPTRTLQPGPGIDPDAD